MFHLLDSKFRQNKARYVVQTVLAMAAVFIVLMVLDFITNAAVIGALGASSFIVFTMPHHQVSRSRYLLSSYAIGIVAGGLCYYLGTLIPPIDSSLMPHLRHALFGAVAVGLAIFVMVVTNSEHPPAAGVALGLVLHGLSLRTLAVVVCGIVLLTLLKKLLKPHLIDLL